MHIGAPKKFKRSAELATQLLSSDTLTRAHGKAAFKARRQTAHTLGLRAAAAPDAPALPYEPQLLEAAMADPARVTAPECRVEYGALLRAARAAAASGVFNAKHKAALEARRVMASPHAISASSDTPYSAAGVVCAGADCECAVHGR